MTQSAPRAADDGRRTTDDGFGLRVRPEDTLLAQRAADFLARGPADAASIVAYACNLPSPPLIVAERLANAILRGRREFVCGEDGVWRLEERRRKPRTPDDDVPLPSLTFAVVDVETTGGRAYGGDRITEIAVAVVKNGAITEKFESLVNPERPIPPIITALTNITWDMVKNAPTFTELAPRVTAALSGHIFTAHNATFDWKFVCAELSRAEGRVLEGRRLCTVRLARRVLPQLPRRSLDHLARYYGVTIERRHRAGGDAFATAECLVRLLGDACDRGCATWGDLERLGRPPKAKRRRRPRATPTAAADTAA